ncbi:TetR/AcrR family transcriptional regulator [Aeromonas veronii]|uniref:TetR/AcrR family transcriptional regulator n=1 Tax=Aeromonas veronii TaxID=654 RepID=UPI001115D8DA|nr:TetR/AcrR family transcriptional regulator [Aeromonas veronii]KAE9637403.1 TetR family transcriptional regulator [Aeromonas veronii]TNJ07529.1 TetR family transcriptional regulator [Aeromonas veronii]UYB70408.1 TetR/AcrR family transcriptional regulator [Aeromonas veronii]
MPINHFRLEQRRELIIQAALGCFIERGFHQTGMRDIATAAGVSLGNLYNHFARKEELIALIASLEAGELQPLLDELDQGSARTALARFAIGYLAWSQTPENLLLGTEILAELTRHPEMAATFASNQRQICDALASTIRRGQQEGCLEARLDPTLTSQLLLDGLEGQALRDALLLHPDQPSAAQRLPQLLDLLLGPAN